MPFVVKQDVPTNPERIRLLGADAVVARPDGFSNLTVSTNIGHYMRFFNFFVKDDERIGAI
jgi:hypothetical protein